MTAELKGLKKAEDIVANKQETIRTLKKNGQKVFGHYCCSVPREIFTAAQVIPYRLMGDPNESVTEGDTVLETIMCPFIRSTIDLALKGKYDFLDGVVVPHMCENIERMYDYWSYYLPGREYYFLDVPHLTYPSSAEFYANNLKEFNRQMERIMGGTISDKDIAAAIDVHEENRTLLKQLYELRRQDPPLLSGAEAATVVMAGSIIPVEEHNHLLKEIIAELPGRKDLPAKSPRLMLWSAHLDSTDLIDLVEETGSSLVVDDSCLGTRFFNFAVEKTGDPFAGLADSYLRGQHCPRYFTNNQSMDERYAYLLDLAKGFHVDGVILYVTRYCDTHAYDVPRLKAFLEEKGYPVLHLEDEYSIVSSKGQLKTRIQAFTEML